MNIIFLDIDGPLLPKKMYLYSENYEIRLNKTPHFDPYAVRCFNLWTKYADAKTVLSTNWTWSFSIDDLKLMLANNGLVLNYHDEIQTPKHLSSSYRHSEILSWLESFSHSGDRFIVVDDDTSCGYINKIINDDKCPIKSTGEWINVDYNNGLTYNNFIEGCNFLNINIDDMWEQEFKIKKLTKEEREQRQKDLELLSRCL